MAVGEIFSSPTAAAFLDAFKAADSGRGVACLYGNYAGDNMNVKMAIRKAKAAGITVKTVVANDDCASAPKDEISKRRGVAGEVLMWKVGGAKAAMGADLDEVIAAAQKAIDNTRSVGIGTAPCTIAAVGHPNFTIEDGTMEVGIGHHGEMCIRDSLMAYHFVHRVDTLRIDRHGLTQRLILQHLAAFLIEGILNITGNIDLIYTQFYSLSDLFIRVSGTSVQYLSLIHISACCPWITASPFTEAWADTGRFSLSTTRVPDISSIFRSISREVPAAPSADWIISSICSPSAV